MYQVLIGIGVVFVIGAVHGRVVPAKIKTGRR